MRVFIAGVDGYLGWSLAQYLTARGHEVAGADMFLRRRWVEEMGSVSATPIPAMETRLRAFREHFGKELRFWEGDLREYDFVERIFREFQPDAVVHLGECPSAPFSMIDVHHATFVQTNNITTTFNLLYAIHDVRPHAHLLKLGTMGEYGTPGMDIPEGFFEIEYRGRRDRLPFPRQAGSWYHCSKVHGSNNIMLACKIWNLRATDIMQGVVFGTRIDEMGGDERLLTRLDFDEAFGTAINRFCCQAVIGHPLTPFGKGSQKRGFLPLRDSMQCLTLALENPPVSGEYRVFNQFEEVYGINELARKVQKVAAAAGLEVEVKNLTNPRSEQEEHYYKPDHQHLLDLGYEPTHDMEAELGIMLNDLVRHRDRILATKEVLIPAIRWDGARRKSEFLERKSQRSARASKLRPGEEVGKAPAVR
ncbi:MAG: NAD-dependent epimerase/dehydratase family protein [Candidatus Krumholzibacteriota bacterium]|nr:NAD-dependent epimerase/dehydratase family protein [Candidatus Krumholzibacteriota bacterium]